MKSEIKNLIELKTFVEEFIRINSKGGVFGLKGELGAGKTEFVRHCVACLASLNKKEAPIVRSPSFTLYQNYNTEPPVYHFDLYRLSSDMDITEIGLLETIEQSRKVNGFVFVEWPFPTVVSLCDAVISIEVKGESRVFIQED